MDNVWADVPSRTSSSIAPLVVEGSLVDNLGENVVENIVGENVVDNLVGNVGENIVGNVVGNLVSEPAEKAEVEMTDLSEMAEMADLNADKGAVEIVKEQMMDEIPHPLGDVPIPPSKDDMKPIQSKAEPPKRDTPREVKKESVPVESLSDPLSFMAIQRTPIADMSSSARSSLVSMPQATLDTGSNTFTVTVTDPLKVPEALNSYIQYTVRTKTDSPKYRNAEFAVPRRFSDFLWLYNGLVTRYPSLIVPPIPEKLAIGRFEHEFVEARRNALERFLTKITMHPILQQDADLILFLESETFSTDKKKETRGFFASSDKPLVNIPFPKVPDNDKVLESRKMEAEALEVQLKSLAKSLETFVKLRKDQGSAMLELGDAFVALAGVECNAVMSPKLLLLGNIHKRIRELLEVQAKADYNTLAGTVEEHLRIIGSVKVAYGTRSKSYVKLGLAESNLAKKRENLARLTGSKAKMDKIAVAKFEVTEGEKEVENSSKDFGELTHGLIADLERLDSERVFDFTTHLRGFLGSLLETQRGIVSAWESFES